MAEKELEKEKEEMESELPMDFAQGGMTYGDKTYHQYHDQYVPPDSENMMYANGGGIGSMMIPKRQGFFMGGSPLTGESLAIYNSMNAYGYTDQEIADRLSGLGLYDPNVTTPPTTPPPTTPPSSGGGGGGGGDGDGPGPTITTKTRDKKIDAGIAAADADKGNLTLEEITAMNDLSGQESMRGQITPTTTLEKIIASDKPNMLDIAGDSLPFNFDTTDVGNPTNDPRVVSEELGITGFGKPNMRDVAGEMPAGDRSYFNLDDPVEGRAFEYFNDIDSTTVDESISIEDLSKPSNIGDFKVTTAPALTNLSGILNAPPSIGLAQDPDVEDPFDGKYSPSFEEKKAAEGILEGLLEKAANFDLSDLKTMGTNFSINKALQTLGFANIPSFLGTKAITTGIDYFKNKQVQKEIEKQAAATQNRKETREIQARIDAAEKKRQEDIAKRDATAAAKKAASEGRAYDYSGRSNQYGTHTSTISKEKAQDNQDKGRGQQSSSGSKSSGSKSSGSYSSSRGSNFGGRFHGAKGGRVAKAIR